MECELERGWRICPYCNVRHIGRCLHISIWGIEAFSRSLSGDWTEFWTPLWQRGPPQLEGMQCGWYGSGHVISIFACCHSVKRCALAAQSFRSRQNGAVTRIWRSCQVQPSQKERAIGAVRCKKEGMLLQPLRWRCVECAIHHERGVREAQHRYIRGGNKQQ